MCLKINPFFSNWIILYNKTLICYAILPLSQTFLQGSGISTGTLYELHYGELKKTVLPIRVIEKRMAEDDDFSKTEHAVGTGNRGDRYTQAHKPLGISRYVEKDIKISTGNGMRILS